MSKASVPRYEDTSEVNDLEHPKYEDTLSHDMPESGVSKTESALRGAAQGASLGFADEITGGAQSLLDYATNPAVKDLIEQYRQRRDESRAAYKGAQEANPMTYGAGELGGGLATLAIPGANVGAGATIGRAAIESAGLGALGGLGSTNADLTQGTKDENLKAAQDVSLGAAMGGAAGALGQGLTKLKELPDKVSWWKDVADTFKYKRKGIDVTSEEAAKNISKEMLDQSGKVLESVEEAGRKAGKEVQAAFDAASDMNLAESTIDALKKRKEKLQDLLKDQSLVPDRKSQVKDAIEYLDQAMTQRVKVPKNQPLSSEIETFSNQKPEMIDKILPKEKITPGDVRGLRDRLKEHSSIIEKTPGADPFAKLTNEYTGGYSDLVSLLNESIPGLNDANAKSASIFKIKSLLDTAKPVFEKEGFRDTKKVAELMADLEKHNIKGAQSESILNRIKELAKDGGADDVVKLIDDSKDISRKYDLSQKSQKEGIAIKPIGATFAAAGIQGAGLLGTGKMGALTEGLTNVVTSQGTKDFVQSLGLAGSPVMTQQSNPVLDVVHRMKNATPEEMARIQSRLSQTAATKPLADALQRAMAENDGVKRAAAEMAIGQNKQARQILQE